MLLLYRLLARCVLTLLGVVYCPKKTGRGRVLDRDKVRFLAVLFALSVSSLLCIYWTVALLDTLYCLRHCSVATVFRALSVLAPAHGLLRRLSGLPPTGFPPCANSGYDVYIHYTRVPASGVSIVQFEQTPARFSAFTPMQQSNTHAEVGVRDAIARKRERGERRSFDVLLTLGKRASAGMP